MQEAPNDTHQRPFKTIPQGDPCWLHFKAIESDFLRVDIGITFGCDDEGLWRFELWEVFGDDCEISVSEMVEGIENVIKWLVAWSHKNDKFEYVRGGCGFESHEVVTNAFKTALFELTKIFFCKFFTFFAQWKLPAQSQSRFWTKLLQHSSHSLNILEQLQLTATRTHIMMTAKQASFILV